MKTKVMAIGVIILLIISGVYVVFLNSPQEQYGYWKTDTKTDSEIIQKLVGSEPSNCEEAGTCRKEILNEDKRIVVASINAKNTENITLSEIDAKNRFIQFLEGKNDVLGITSPLTIKSIEKGPNGYDFIVEPQKYAGVIMCGEDGYDQYISVLNDGSIGSFRLVLYPNLTAPTQPKLTDEQIKQKLGITFPLSPSKLCIFPKWHPEGEYWTYHLAKNFDGLIIDSWTGEPLFEPKAIVE